MLGLLIAVASLVAERGFQAATASGIEVPSLVAPTALHWHVESPWTRERTHFSPTGRQIFSH